MNTSPSPKSNQELQAEVHNLKEQLAIANDTLDAIRTGQIDALVVKGHSGHIVYTLKSADLSYRIFIERMSEGAITLNSNGVILYCNSKFASMVERPLSKVLGCPFRDFFAEEHQQKVQSIVEKAWTTDSKGETELLSGGTSLPVQLSLTRLALDEGISLSVLLTDLSAQKVTEQKLKTNNEQLESLNAALSESNSDLQQFASVASHDLQEPLRKILVFSNFIKERSTGESSNGTGEFLQKIISSAQRMKVLILDVLNYSRLSATDTNFEKVPIRSLVEELIEDFEIKIAETNAKIITEALPVVEVNRGQIRQVFQNIISNALKFARPGLPPEITITQKDVNANELGLSLLNEADYCRISIKDNGIGFDPQYASTIFSLFEKLNSKSAYEGSGIGLAIAKKIVDKHHGLIIARSTEGNGAEFNIILPFKRLSYHVV